MQAKASQQDSPQRESTVIQARQNSAGAMMSGLPASTARLLDLQHSHGNRFVQRFLDRTVVQRACACGGSCANCGKSAQSDEPEELGLRRKPSTLRPFIQAKLTVSQPGDPYEQEADRVAEEVMRMPEASTAASPISSQQPSAISQHSAATSSHSGGQQAGEDRPAADEEHTVERLLSFKEIPGTNHDIGAELASQIQRLHGGGEPLSEDLRRFFEPRFGSDFSQVRIHTDPVAAGTAQRVNARAYTLGNDIAFAPGEFQSNSQEGRKLLAHELTHVVQQGSPVRNVNEIED